MGINLIYFINKNIRNLSITFLCMLSLTFIYSQQILPTILNVTLAPFELDYKSAFIQENMMTLVGNNNEFKVNKNLSTIWEDLKNKKINDEQFKQQIIDHYKNPREFNIEQQENFYIANVYMQNNKYKFKINPVKVYDLDLSYETTYSIKYDGIKSNPTKPVLTHKYLLFDTGKVFVLAKVVPDFEIKQSQIYKGVFIPINKILIEDIQSLLGEGNNIQNLFVYELDTLTSFSSYERNDLFILILLLVITLIMGIKMVIYKIDYRYHPTYKQLDKLINTPFENEVLIDSELKEESKVTVNGNKYMTEHWEITKGLFKTKITNRI